MVPAIPIDRIQFDVSAIRRFETSWWCDATLVVDLIVDFLDTRRSRSSCGSKMSRPMVSRTKQMVNYVPEGTRPQFPNAGRVRGRRLEGGPGGMGYGFVEYPSSLDDIKRRTIYEVMNSHGETLDMAYARYDHERAANGVPMETGYDQMNSAAARRYAPPDQPRTAVYVYNVGDDADELALWQLFGPFGAIDSIKVIKDAETKKNRGFAFVNMRDREEAARAIRALDGHALNGQALSVSFKTHKKK